jgi:hypothetical protein
MKPVELIDRALANSSQAGAMVVDPFGGSGSTLIACHRKDRIAALMEIDPRYVDVICRRFMDFSGKAAILESTGQTFDEVAQQRKGASGGEASEICRNQKKAISRR